MRCRSSEPRTGAGRAAGARRSLPGRISSPGAACSLALLILVQWAVAAPATEFQRTFTFQAREITVSNFIGAVRVEPTSGNEVRVVVDVRGKDADPRRIEFQEQRDAGARLTIRFPLKDTHRFVYPEMRGGRTSISIDDDHPDRDWFSQLIASALSDRIEVRGRPWRDALELWADVVVQVPSSQRATVQLGVGSIEARDVQADLRLRVRSGPVRAEGVRGELDIDTGSGSVEAARVQGDLHIDTGSGGVEIAGVRDAKRIAVDTGSGSVQVSDVAADALSIDTGSGGVDLDRVQVDDLTVDTGSGGIEGSEVGADRGKLDTGSGSVRLELVRMGHGPFDVDTGSGGIRLRVPPNISASFAVDTGSGDIDTDLESITLSKMSRGRARFRVGDGDASVNLSTGSGSVQVLQGSGTASPR